MALTPAIRIVTDRVADLPDALIRRFNIQVVPVYVSLGAQRRLDDGTLDRKEFYQALRQGAALPGTAAPSPYEFLRAYQQLADEGAEHIIGLFASASVSSIHTHAQFAVQLLSQVQVHIVDTEQVSMGIGWLVVTAAEAIERGASWDEVLVLLTRMRARTQVVGVLDSAEHLQRSGRVSWAMARFIELLQIKPLIIFEGGAARLLGRVRTFHRALDRLVEHLTQMAPLERLAIIHTYAEAPLIERLQQILEPLAPERPIPVVEVGPVFGAHIGPGCLGVAVVGAEKNRSNHG